MKIVRKTITLTDQQDSWIKAQIDAGHYTNDSEYIRVVLIEGEASGEPSPFDADAFKQRMLTTHG
jgi:antitoxin ParD1/3/4